MKQAFRHLMPGVLLLLGLLGVAAAWYAYNQHVVNSDFPTGTVLAVIGAAAGVYMLILANFMLWRRLAFLMLNPYAILGAYLAILVVLFLAVADAALYVVLGMKNGVTF